MDWSFDFIFAWQFGIMLGFGVLCGWSLKASSFFSVFWRTTMRTRYFCLFVLCVRTYHRNWIWRQWQTMHWWIWGERLVLEVLPVESRRSIEKIVFHRYTDSPSVLLTVSMSFVFKNVFLFLQELIFRYCDLHTILQNSMLLGYCLVLQSKHLAYTESKENTRLNYILKKCGDAGFV